MATPALRVLKNRYPKAEIDFLCSQAARPLLAEHPAIAQLFTLAQRNVPYLFSLEKRRLACALRERQYDIGVLLESGRGYRELLDHAGITEIREIRATYDPKVHSIVNNIRATGGDDTPPPMELHLAPRDEMRAFEMLRDVQRPRIGLHSGYGPMRGKSGRQQDERLRAWGAENFARLARLLRDRHDPGFILTGSAADLPLTSRIVELMGATAPGLVPAPVGPATAPAIPLLLAGRTSVGEMAAVIGQLDLLISVDSGPAHIAAALGTPLVVLWGPGILEQTCPWGDPQRISVLRHPVFCAPCYGTPAMSACERNICMESISPMRVANEATRMFSIPAS